MSFISASRWSPGERDGRRRHLTQAELAEYPALLEPALILMHLIASQPHHPTAPDMRDRLMQTLLHSETPEAITATIMIDRPTATTTTQIDGTTIGVLVMNTATHETLWV